MRYFVAMLAAIAILSVFAIVAASIGWQSGGGYMVQALLWLGIIVPVWVVITRSWNKRQRENISNEHLPNDHHASRKVDTRNLMKESNMVIDDLPLYAQAMEECGQSNERRDPGLWAKAFCLSGGDEQACKAKYIELRVEDLSQKIISRAQEKEELPTFGGSSEQQKQNTKGKRRSTGEFKIKKLPPATPAMLLAALPVVCPHCHAPQVNLTDPLLQSRYKLFPNNWIFDCKLCGEFYDLRELVGLDGGISSKEQKATAEESQGIKP